jgi:hypothetical protein
MRYFDLDQSPDPAFFADLDDEQVNKVAMEAI